ncbi:DNA polymerase, beta-like region [Methanospirillum hungatei JF-1]|jgi:predicted nucleotidyltransferase|uniref:DNA polymerase, beta-like region n=1 Tax=Methanospirillum hungatei JF-1 (strain ATCC 27890 / DSM 864 / NBRC 100397 / JF-1) TaxID=323259 RepID=Q2FMS6_METHJ|nr:nucleotidyltransferase domain-containing protein [Methanospirillum hungatei]ABD39909.1 DNA polymerase, beta-like region [Methanospirillum hungatei JF-1]
MNPAIKDTNKDVIQKALEIMKNSTDFSKIRFIALYGSVATGESTIHSDIDITISCTMERLEAELYRISLLSELPEKIALNIFENLPLYIRKSVLGGVFLYMQDEDEVYDLAYDTIREYNLFKPHLDDYTGERFIA